MPEVNPKSNRLDALFRVVLLVFYVPTLWLLVLTVGLVGGAVFFLVDVLKQLVLGGSGWSSSGGGFFETWSTRLFFWPLEQLKYIVGTDTTGFPLLP